MTTLTKNDVLLEGTPLAVPEWSHENHGTQFYRLLLEVPRLSGTPDTLPLLLPKALAARVKPGEPSGSGASSAPSATAAAWGTSWC